MVLVADDFGGTKRTSLAEARADVLVELAPFRPEGVTDAAWEGACRVLVAQRSFAL